jgi:hypothetical protein
MEKLQKRVDAHANTIGVWLAPTAIRLSDETDRQYAERLISLGAHHAMKTVNAPLLRSIVEASYD